MQIDTPSVGYGRERFNVCFWEYVNERETIWMINHHLKEREEKHWDESEKEKKGITVKKNIRNKCSYTLVSVCAPERATKISFAFSLLLLL